MERQKCEAVLLPFVGDVLERLNQDQWQNQRCAFAERAGIVEYEGKQPRALAESLALLETLVRWPALLTGMVAVEIELDGATQWLLTTDLAFARQQIKAMGAVEVAVLDPAEVVSAQYHGVAVLGFQG